MSRAVLMNFSVKGGVGAQGSEDRLRGVIVCADRTVVYIWRMRGDVHAVQVSLCLTQTPGGR